MGYRWVTGTGCLSVGRRGNGGLFWFGRVVELQLEKVIFEFRFRVFDWGGEQAYDFLLLVWIVGAGAPFPGVTYKLPIRAAVNPSTALVNTKSVRQMDFNPMRLADI